MPSKNGTATLSPERALDDYTLDMRLSKLSAPQTARFLRLQATLQHVEELNDPAQVAAGIEQIVDFARTRVRRKDGAPITPEEIEWCLETLPLEDLMALFGGSEAAVVPPTNASN